MKLINASKYAAADSAGDLAFEEFIALTHVPTAAEVTAGEVVIELEGTPVVAIAQLRVTSTGAAKAWDGDVIIGSDSVTLNNDGAVDFAATDTFSVILAI